MRHFECAVVFGYDDIGSSSGVFTVATSRTFIQVQFLMTRKTTAVNVKGIVPTAAEWEKAKLKREAMNNKGARAVKASVRHFFSANKDLNEELTDGKVDNATIDKWLVWLSRCDDAAKTCESNRDFKKGSQKFNDLHWYSKETLQEFGEKRAEYWLSTGLLPERGDRITGKKGEWITEYGVPNDWERLSEEDWRTLRSKTEFELNKDNAEEETEAFTRMAEALINTASSSGSRGPEGGETIIKKEVPTAGDIMADKVMAMKAQKEQVLARMRLLNLSSRQMAAKAKDKQASTGKEAHTFFIGECGTIEKETNKAIKALERMCIEGEVAAESELPKLVKLVEGADDKYPDVVDWGRKFKFTDVAEKAPRKRKNTA